MRAFIAIELPESIKDGLSQIQSHLKYAGADVKWVDRNNMHLTLKFLGETSDERIIRVKKTLDRLGELSGSFEISLKNAGAFPKIESPGVLWVGLDKGAKDSTELAGRIDEELSKTGFDKESRPFTAHLTIGRVRSAKNRKALAEKLSAVSIQPSAKDQLVTSVVLFQSTLTPNGAIYTKLHEARLKSSNRPG